MAPGYPLLAARGGGLGCHLPQGLLTPIIDDRRGPGSVTRVITR
jgi:hypothetical protein